MGASTIQARRNLRTLAAVALAALTLASPAAAADKLINTPAEKFVTAPGGVDLRTGRFVYEETDLAIGGEGNAGMTFSRTLTATVPGHSNSFGNLSHNWDIMVSERRLTIDNPELSGGSDFEVNVHFGGRSMTYQSRHNQIGFEKRSPGAPAPLTYSGDRAGAAVYTYTAADGTVALFRPIGTGECSTVRRCAYVSEITEVDGTKFTFSYLPAGAGVRLTRVTSSRGYALLLEGSGPLVAKACLINLAQMALPAGDVCPAGVPAATYSYTGDNRIAAAIGPDNAASQFRYETPYSAAPGALNTIGFVKPGYSAPWLTNRSHIRIDEIGVPQEIVEHQAYAGGSSYSYQYQTSPPVSYKPQTYAGGSFVNALGEGGGADYGWPIAPRSPQPGGLCSPFPCAEVMPDDDVNNPGVVYQQTPAPVTITGEGGTTSFDFCDPKAMAELDYRENYRCVVMPAAHSIVDPEGHRTELKYDGNWNVVEAKRLPRPGALNPDGSVPAPIVTSAAYVTALSRASNKPLWMKDARGNQTSWTYAPEHGGVLTETGPAVDGVTPQKRYSYVQRYARLADGSIAGPPVWLLDRTSTCRTGNPAGAGCALGAADEVLTLYDYGPDSAGNNLLLRGQAVVADGEVLRTCYAYDGLGRKISETSPNGTAGLSACPASAPASAMPFTTSTRYDSDGRVTGTIAPDPDGPGGLPHPAVRNSYDSAGRLIRAERGALSAWQGEGVAPALWPGFVAYSALDTSYDALDRKTREQADGVRVTEYGYDLAGRLQCTAVRMNPDVWATELPDKCVPGPAHPVHGADRITRNVYDQAGRLVQVWEGVGTPLERREAAWTYNSNGQKTSLTDARGYRAEMSYDGFGLQRRWTFPSKTSLNLADPSDYEEYLYDPNGNRTSLRKRDGSVLAFHYDALNRMTAKIVPERVGLDGVHSRDVYYAYDLRGLQTEARFGGPAGEGVSNAWDGFGRLVSTTTSMGGMSRTLAHRFDREGREVELSFPDGHKFWTRRDGLGRMVGSYHGPLGDSSTGLAGFHFDSASHLHRFERRWGSATNFIRDYQQRLVTLQHGFADSASAVDWHFAYNPAGQLSSETRTNDAYAWTGSVAVSRAYSTNGQNQYLAAGPASFAYDPNGNLVAAVNAPQSTTYIYDIENRLVQASGGSNAALFYDPLGRLFQVWSPDSGATTRFLHDGDELVAEYDGSGTLLRRYIHGDGDDDPLYWFEGPGLDKPRFPHADRQGSIVATAQPGGVLAINTYDEYGIPGTAQRDWTALGSHGRFQYTGQSWIPEIGMYYYKARIYSPTLGRFLQVDPIGYDDQINLYAYVSNDPMNRVDPSGQEHACVYSPGQCGARDITPEEQRRREETVDTLYEVSGAKAVVNFFKNPSLGSLASAAVAIVPAGKVAKPIAVIGHYVKGAGYVGLAQKLGARYFSVPTEIWNKMTPAQQWGANKKFLDRQVADGAMFKLSHRAQDAVPGSAFAKEVRYLKSKGYRVSDDGLTMAKSYCNTAASRLC